MSVARSGQCKRFLFLAWQGGSCGAPLRSNDNEDDNEKKTIKD